MTILQKIILLKEEQYLLNKEIENEIIDIYRSD